MMIMMTIIILLIIIHLFTSLFNTLMAYYRFGTSSEKYGTMVITIRKAVTHSYSNRVCSYGHLHTNPVF
jgi:hypothetical protein